MSFNENKIKFCSTPLPNSMLDVEMKYNKILSTRSQNNINSPIEHRLRHVTSSNY